MATPDSITPPPPVRLLIVDADRRVRESLASLVGSCERVSVVGEAGHSGQALELIEEHVPEVVILDPKLPEIDHGLALIRTIRHRWPGVVVLAMGWSDELEASCLSAGADGFVPKTDTPNEFVEAILVAGSKRATNVDHALQEPIESPIPGNGTAAIVKRPAGASRIERRGATRGTAAPIASILHHGGEVADAQALPSSRPLPSPAPPEPY